MARKKGKMKKKGNKDRKKKKMERTEVQKKRNRRKEDGGKENGKREKARIKERKSREKQPFIYSISNLVKTLKKGGKYRNSCGFTKIIVWTRRPLFSIKNILSMMLAAGCQKQNVILL